MWVPPQEWGREFWGFAKRPDHCVEEDILEKGDGKLGSMCAKSWHVSWYTPENLWARFRIGFEGKYSWPKRLKNRVRSLTIKNGGARGVMVIVVGNWHCDTSSIPG